MLFCDPVLEEGVFLTTCSNLSEMEVHADESSIFIFKYFYF